MQSEYGRIYADLYCRHWWWRAREQILMRMLRSLDLPHPAKILDVGCGDGLFFPCLRTLGTVEGIEIDESLLSDRNPDRQSISTKPLGDPSHAGRKFDLITALDVVEHIEQDAWAVEQMLGMLKPGGWLVMTVPAFMSLWDHHDEINHHFRRYTVHTVRGLIPPPSRVASIGYLFHSLFVPKWLVARLNRRRARAADQFKIPAQPLNRAAAAYCDLEHRLLGRLGLPFGTSVYVVARAPE